VLCAGKVGSADPCIAEIRAVEIGRREYGSFDGSVQEGSFAQHRMFEIH
jgi:hypothetical protein